MLYRPAWTVFDRFRIGFGVREIPLGGCYMSVHRLLEHFDTFWSVFRALLVGLETSQEAFWKARKGLIQASTCDLAKTYSAKAT